MDVFAELQRLASLIRQLQGALGGKRIIGGAVAGTTAPSIAIVSGDGFSVVRNGAGDYSVTWDVPFAEKPSVAVGMGATAAVLIVKVHAGGPAGLLGVRIAILTTAGVATDGEAHFVAVGR